MWMIAMGLVTVGLQVLGDKSSPCPDVFQYHLDSAGLPYALITIPAPEPDFLVKLQVVLGLNAVLPSKYAGRIELVEGKTEVWRRLVTGSKQPIQYRLYLPLMWTLPTVKHIALNGHIVCSANPQRTLAKLTWEHSLYPLLKSKYPEQIEANKNYSDNEWNTYRPVKEITSMYSEQFTSDTVAAKFPTGEECGISIAGPLPLVINGLPTEKGEWPWLVAMFIKPKSASLQFQCGGSLLSKTIVLTAAHCIKYDRNQLQASDIVLYMGKFDLEDPTETSSQVRDVETVHIHPEYRLDDGRYEADLAVLVLKTVVQYTQYVRPICLWNFSTDINQIIGQTGMVVGWGKYENGTQSYKPRKVSMPIVSHGQCILSNKQFAHIVSNRTFCAGRKDGTGPCSGDSGGGFMIRYQEGNLMRWYLRGVVHLSLRIKESLECDLHNYLVYMDVAMFMDWIRQFVPT